MPASPRGACRVDFVRARLLNVIRAYIHCEQRGTCCKWGTQVSYNKPAGRQICCRLFPAGLRDELQGTDDSLPVEEIRLRAGQPVQLFCGGFERLLFQTASAADCAAVLERACEHSVYAWEEEIQSGFLTLPGGYRMGLCGKAVKRSGRIGNITDVTSLNIRIARAVLGAADALLPAILDRSGTPYPTLILSAPGCGKTTMLRDIARQLSCGLNGARPLRVCVVDERMEIAGSVRGVAQHTLGPRTDVLSGCPKAEGIRLAVRVLSPDVLITDELGAGEDADAVREASYCGVAAIASAHVRDIGALTRRKVLMELVQSEAFERLVVLGRAQGKAGLRYRHLRRGAAAVITAGEGCRMLRILAMLTVFLGCAFAGARASAALRLRRDTLRALFDGLTRLAMWMEFTAEPLAVLAKRAATQETEAFFGRFAGLLATEDDVLSAWTLAMEGARKEHAGFAALREEELQALDEYARCLGGGDRETQRKNTELLKQRLTAALEGAEAAYTRKGRMYRSVGLLSGIAAAILLW